MEGSREGGDSGIVERDIAGDIAWPYGDLQVEEPVEGVSPLCPFPE